MHQKQVPLAYILHCAQPLNKAPSILPSLDNHTGRHTWINVGDEDKDQTALEMS